MYFYAEIGQENEVTKYHNLPTKPNPKDIKVVDGKPALRPVFNEEMPKPGMPELYEITGPEVIVEPERVVRKYKAKLRQNYKEILGGMVRAMAHTARQNLLNQHELAGTGLLMKMMMDEEAEEFLGTSEEDRTKERFPLVFCGVSYVAQSTEEVAVEYRRIFTEVKEKIAVVEGEAFRLIAAIGAANTADAAVRAFDSRMQIFR